MTATARLNDDRWANDPYPDYRAEIARSINFAGVGQDFFTRGKVERLLELMAQDGPLKGRRLLDIGCGIGLMHEPLLAAGVAVTGVDVSAEAVAAAQANHPAGAYATYDGRQTPFPDASFDAALAVCVVHHVPPAGWPAFFREARRVLKPGGCFFVFEHNPFNPGTRLAVARCAFDHDAVLIRSGRAEALMREAGFADPHTQFMFVLPSARPLAKRLERSVENWPLGAQYVTQGRAPA